MATHKDFKTFAVKYNKEFKIAGIHKMKKSDLIDAIEDKLKKSRKEIRDEYKQLKNMVKVSKPKTTTVKPKTTTVKPKTNVRKLNYDETTLRKMYPILINAPLSAEVKKFTKAELDIAYTKVDKVIQSEVEARKWKEAYEDKYPNKELKKKKVDKIFSKPKPAPKKTLSKIDKIKKEEKKEKIIQKKKDDKELKLKSNLSKMLYNKMFGYMTGSSKKSYTEDELLFAYKYKDDFLDGDQLSEWKRVYNDKNRVGKVVVKKPAPKKEPVKKPAPKKEPVKKPKKKVVPKKEPVKKPAPIDPIEDDEDIDDWEGEDLRCYLDTYLRYGKPEDEPWSEVKKGLAKEHQSFDKYKKHLLQGYKKLLTTDKDMTLKNCGDKKFDEAMKQYKSIMNAKNYKEYGAIYRNLNFKGIKKPNPYRKRKN